MGNLNTNVEILHSDLPGRYDPRQLEVTSDGSLKITRLGPYRVSVVIPRDLIPDLIRYVNKLKLADKSTDTYNYMGHTYDGGKL